MTQLTLPGFGPGASGFMYTAVPCVRELLGLKVGFTVNPKDRAQSLARPATLGSMDMIVWWRASMLEEWQFKVAHRADLYPNRTGKQELYLPSPTFVESLIEDMMDAKPNVRTKQGWSFDWVCYYLRDMAKRWLEQNGLAPDDDEPDE